MSDLAPGAILDSESLWQPIRFRRCGFRRCDACKMNPPSATSFNELFLRHQKDVFAYILTLVAGPERRGRHLSADLSGSCWRSRPSTIAQRAFFPWACGFALNEVRRFRRAHHRERMQLSDAVIESLASVQSKSASQIEGQLEMLMDCLDSLPVDKRETLIQCYAHHGGMRDLAVRLALDPNTLYKRLERHSQNFDGLHGEGQVTAKRCMLMTMREEGSTAENAMELCSLAEAVCNGTITTAQYERLNERLSGDEEAARFYATYVRMHGLLLWHWRDADVSPASSPAFPIIVETSPLSAEPSSLFANLFSPGGYRFSYSLAVLIVGIGLLIGWACRIAVVQPDVNIAEGTQQQSNESHPDKPQSAVVARITGMLECRWENPRSAPVGFDSIVQDRKFALLAGLMEITYDTGAKVILQGPCKYQVDSASGGFLSVGRLTAKVAKGGTAAKKENPVDRQSPGEDRDSPVFVVRTPTACVTDLGTEFGVEVDASGASRTHVCRGKVEVRGDRRRRRRNRRIAERERVGSRGCQCSRTRRRSRKSLVERIRV